MNRLSLNLFVTLLATFLSVLLAAYLIARAAALPPPSKGFWVYLNITGPKPHADGLQIHTSDEQLHRAIKPSHIPPELRK